MPREPETTESGDAAIVDYIILSRRSKNRAGLRYQRRGIDDDAHVANFVETETIMRVEVSRITASILLTDLDVPCVAGGCVKHFQLRADSRVE